ncbi:bifunctional adenosylcobinamide kinase/adenosylcobinamide-phosphate guanylyltransferase [Gottfriedia acidiceleris]|uniref:bifunctional adenosylcobinamide kinase/adenosylcobinamide-phosphate guanylyltransferase n=1 Tax=Gottfriedia acidiceleris TaxID=371036 RepID=UPI001145C3C8
MRKYLAFSHEGRVLYVAFGVQTDQEMEKRIDSHMKRGPTKMGHIRRVERTHFRSNGLSRLRCYFS